MREAVAGTYEVLEKQKKHAVWWKIAGIGGKSLLIFLGILAVWIFRSVLWVLKTWDNLSMEEIVYHLKMPLEGTNSSMVWDYLRYCAVAAGAAAAILVGLLHFIKRRKKIRRIMYALVPMMSILLMVLSVMHVWTTLDVSAYIKNQKTYSSFIDDNYVDPASVDITFPEKKRNLIYIYLESMEDTYADIKSGGAFEQNVIPELTEISMMNENFSGEENILNGAYVSVGTTWTAGAMFAQTSGLPLTIPVEKNSMGSQNTFFPELITLGDILRQEGYTQELVIGSEAQFGGRELYFEEHGDYQMFDYFYSLNNGEIPEGYRVWWGYEDEKLFENAKKRLNELAESGKPFNMTMLTADTHFEDGYVCRLCGHTFGEDQYSNVMACSSRQVAEFVSWIQQQPFYENTTIVISGDHLTMDSDYCQDVADTYQRKVYTAYINAPISVENNTYREYSTLDAFPTTLASLNVDIEGNHLGLGTNLFSSEKTLVEKYGMDQLNQGLAQKSRLMEKLWSTINRANVSEIEYDEQQQVLRLSVSDIQWEQSVKTVKAAVRLENNQDLGYFTATEQGNHSYEVEVPLIDLESNNGIYQFDIFLELQDGDKIQIDTKSYEFYSQINSISDQKNCQMEIQITSYDYHTGKFSVSISKIEEDNLKGIRCAVWAHEDQSDLRWYDAIKQMDGTYVAEVYASDFDFEENIYQVHIYLIDNDEIPILIGTAQEKIGEI